MRVYTIGHSTRTFAELAALLEEAGIEVLADVRSYPRSRTNPQFNVEVLPAALAPHGIAYRHLRALGGRRSAQKLDRPSPNGWWRVPAFRNYADYALTPAYRDGMEDLRGLAEERTAAVMCAEAQWSRCHRQIITDYLLASGAEVVHILGPGRHEPARLTPGAEPQEGGAVHYPAAQGTLL